MDMSLEEVIIQKNIKRPRLAGGDDGQVKKKTKLVGVVNLSGAQKKKIKRQKVLGAVSKNGLTLSSAAGAVRKLNSRSDSSKLIISNLCYDSVTDTDIIALFREFGPIKKAGLHYDKNGKSQGSAEVVYERHVDAIKAMSKYNGVPLDGREMVIQLAVSEIPAINPARLGIKNGIGGNNKIKSKNDKEMPSTEVLDAELEEYISKRALLR